MRITREILIRNAKENVQQRVHADRSIMSAYVTGSLLSDNPFLGGATDIDLVFIHNVEPKQRRELVPLSHEIHLDIQHRSTSEFDHPRELRVDPWLGSDIYAPMLLHDTRHFFEFVQASMRGRFDEPENILLRARTFLDSARQTWSSLQISQQAGPELLKSYLEAVYQAANAVAVLNGNPLPERRVLSDFPARAEIVGRPGLYAGLLGLLGGNKVDASAVSNFIPAWQEDFTAAASRPKVASQVAAARLGYYKPAFDAWLAENAHPFALWPLLYTWTLAAAALPPSQQQAWKDAAQALGLLETGFSERLDGLDLYLDDIDELLETLAKQDGI